MAKTTEMILDANLTGNLGDTVTVGGKNYIIGETAFANLKEIVTAAASIPDNVVITVKGGTYADDIDFTTPLDKNAGISFVAAKDETVIFSGKTTLGYRDQGVGAKMWNGPISFTGITFDQAKAGEHSIDVQDVKGLVLRNCTIIGDGEYGIGSSRGNATAPSSIIGCTFENASIQVTGNFGTGLVIDGCTFNESRVNVQSGNSVTIQNSTFSRTLTDAAVGDSFYLIRSNSNPITIKNCVANVDSTVTTGEAQEEWALLWARNANGPKWNVDGLEVNMTDAAMAQGSLDVIKNGKTPAQNTPDRINVSGLTSNQEIADIIAKTDGSVNIFTEGGYASYKDGVAEKTFSFTTVYVNSTFAGTFGEEIETGKFFGVNAFADINAAEIAAEASAVKMVIEAGSDVTYTKDQYYFLNTNESLNADSEGNKINALDEVVGAADSYDMEVNGTLRAYQVLLNNAETTVSATGRLLATGENFRVMGGTITVQGTREANAAAPAEVFTGSWGGGTKAGADTQIQGGYIDINQGAEAAFDDTVIFVHAGFFNVNASTAAFDNTYIYLGSGGSYADIQMNITNGAEVTFANNTTVLNDATFGMHITVGENSKLNLNNATLALDNSKKTTSLTNNGTVTISGASTVKIGTVTGNAIQVLDGATITDSTIGGAVNMCAGESTWQGTNSVSGVFSVGYNSSTAAVTANVTGNFSTTNALIGSKYDHKLNVGTANGARTTAYFGQLGTFGDVAINNADITYGYAFIRNDFTVSNSKLTINGGINTYFAGNAKVVIDNTTWSLPGSANIGSYGRYMYGNADVTLTNGSTMTATTMGIERADGMTVKLTVKEGSSFTATKLSIDAGAEVKIDGSNLTVHADKNAGTLTNNGTITVSGESTVVIDSLTGNGIILNNATLTAASNIANSPATKIYGTSTIKGTVGTVHANYTDTKVNDKRIGYTTEAVALTLDGATTGNVYVGSDTEGYAATLTVKGGSKTGQIYSRVYGTTTITGSDNTIKYINAKGSVNIVDAAGTTITEGIVAEAGNIAITNSTVSLGIGGSYVTQLDKGTTMTVTGSNIDVQQMTIDATSALVLNNSTISVDDVYNDGDIITNNGSITISGTSTVKLDKIDGSGWVYMAGATIDEETSFKGANVRFASGENIVDGSVIKDGRFQVGTGLWGVEDPRVSKDGVTVTVKNNAFIGGFDGSASPFGGWVGSQGYDGKVVAADAPRYTLNVQNSNANFGYMHVSHDGVMTITGNAAEMQKYTGVEHSYYSGYLNINGVVTFDAANALVLFTNVSVDNGSTENPGKLIIQNGANYVSYRDSSTKDVSFTISQSGIVEVNNATLDLRHGTLIKENASLSITNNGIFKGNAVTNNGTFSFDQTAKITVGSIVNTGTINVTVTGEAATNYFGGLVIDANAASDYGQVNVSVEGKNFEAVVNGNDLYVVDTTIYVNSAWAGKEDGADLGGGKYFNVNAFASLGSVTPGLTEGARQVQFTYNGTAPGLEITVTNDAAGSSLIYGFGGQTYASLGGANVHEFAPETGKTYIFDFKQGDFSFAVNEIKANEDTTVTPETGSNSASGTVDVAVNEFTGRKDIGFTVATGMEGAIELDIANLDGAAWVVLYDADGKTVKEHVVIRDGKVTFKDLAAGSYEVAISPAGIPSEVECDVTYNFTQEAVVVTDDTWNNATLFGVDTTAGTTVTGEFDSTDVIDWFKFTAADGVNAINFTGDGDFSVIAYTMNGDKLQQCAAFWVFDEKATGVDYTRYLNVAAGSEVYLRIEGYGKTVDYSVALAPQA